MITENEPVRIFFREAERNDHSQIQEFIELVDSEFYPPLSGRPGGIEGRIEDSLAKTDSNFLMAEGISVSRSSSGLNSRSSSRSNSGSNSGSNSESGQG